MKPSYLWIWWEFEGKEMVAVLVLGFVFGLATGGLIVWAMK